MNYLVTGGAGFIGSAIIRRLIDEGNKCTTVDNLSTGIKSNIPQGCEFILGDVFDKNIIDGLKAQRYDAIIHIAGQSSGEVSFDDPVYDLQTNTQSTLLLLNLAKEIGCKKFVYASSMSVYGDHNPPVCFEETPTIPKSFYAVGKLASENYMRIFSQFGISCTALRFFNVYGIGQNMSNLRQGMASIFMAMAIKDHKVLVKGSKDRFRDFVYIDDVVDAVVKTLDYKKDYDVFNVCTGIPTTVEKVVDTIKENLAFDVSVEYSGGTPGDQFGIYGDNKKAMELLSWKPEVDFETGIKKMTKWAMTLEELRGN